MNRLPTILLVLACLSALGCADDNRSATDDLEPFEPGAIDDLECTPDLDGEIRADQLQPAFGIPLNYRVSPDGEQRAVDLQGFLDLDDRRVWDLDVDYGSDQRLQVVAQPLDDQWYADDFPDGEFTTVLDPTLDLDAVYSHDGQTLYLHGYASATEHPPQGTTLAPYEEPVIAYDFPLEEGHTWSGTGAIRNGLVQGVTYSGDDHYDFEVDATGRLWLPDIRFDSVLRVRTRLTIEPVVGQRIYREQIQFLFECFGEVTRIVGPDRTLETDETPPIDDYDFSMADHMRRLGF